MRLLIIAPYYYPYINPRAFRWTAIAEHWAEAGIEVHVVCSKREDWPDYSRHKGVHLHRVGYNSLKEIFYNYFRPSYRRGEAPRKEKPGLPKPGRHQPPALDPRGFDSGRMGRRPAPGARRARRKHRLSP